MFINKSFKRICIILIYSLKDITKCYKIVLNTLTLQQIKNYMIKCSNCMLSGPSMFNKQILDQLIHKYVC